MDPGGNIEKLTRKQFPFIVMGISGDHNKNLGLKSENLSPPPKTIPDQQQQPGNSKILYHSNPNPIEKPKYPNATLISPTSLRKTDLAVTVTGPGDVTATSPSPSKVQQTSKRQQQRTPFTVTSSSSNVNLCNVSLLEGIAHVITNHQGQKPFRNTGNGNFITSPECQMKLVGKEQQEQRGHVRLLDDAADGKNFPSTSVATEKINGKSIGNSKLKNLKFYPVNSGSNSNSIHNVHQRDFHDFNDWTLQEKFDELFLKMRQKEDEICCLRAEVSNLKETIHKNSAETGASKHLYHHMQKQIETIEEKIELHQNEFVPPSFISGNCDTINTPASSSRGSISDSSVTEFDYEKFIRSVKQLNMRVEQGHSMELCFTSGGATFKRWDGIKLTLFKNGLLLGTEKDFMPFASSRAKMFAQDILDGFFPNEFQCVYPQGVYFVIKDIRTCNYNGDPNFSGEGHVLNNSAVRENLPNLVPGSHVSTLKQRQFCVPSCAHTSSSSYYMERVMSAESTESATSRSSSSSIKEADELPTLRASYEVLMCKRSRGYSDKIISVKLKNIINGHCYKLNISVFARISEIIDHLNNQIELGPGEEFKLIHSLPMGILSVSSATLKDYGIEGNAVLYYRVDRM